MPYQLLHANVENLIYESRHNTDIQEQLSLLSVKTTK